VPVSRKVLRGDIVKYIARCELGGSVFDKYIINAESREKAQLILESKCKEHGLNVIYFWLIEVQNAE